MSQLKKVSPFIVLVLVFSLVVSPLTYAQESTATAPTASSVAPAPAMAPETAPAALASDWWKVPANSRTTYPGNDAFFDPDQATGSRTWTKGGKVMTGIGLAMVGIGAIMMAKGSSEDEIGDSGLAIDWKVTGGLWIAGGAVLAIIGLTRRH